MRSAKPSTNFAALLAAITILSVAARSSPAQQNGHDGAVVPTTDEYPIAPRAGAATPPAGSSYRFRMASLFQGLTEDTVIWPTRTFAIPFQVDTSGTRAVEVQLFVSRGPGTAWRLIDRKTSSDNEFPFEADEDGLYWFATRTFDETTPEEGRLATAQPIDAQLKIFVDTARPRIELLADVDAAGRVAANIVVDDATPLRSVQLHYVTDLVRTWHSLDVNRLDASGDIHFQPGGAWQQLSLQAVVVDSAGHQEIVSKWLQRPRIATIAPANDASTAIASHTAQYRTSPPRSDGNHLPARPVTAPIKRGATETSFDEAKPVDGISAQQGISAKEEGTAEPSERVAANPYRSSNLLNAFRGSLNGAEPTGAKPPQWNPYGRPSGGLPPSLAAQSATSPRHVAPPSPSPMQPQPSPNDLNGPWPRETLPAPASPDQVTQGFVGRAVPPAAVTTTGPITAPAESPPESPPESPVKKNHRARHRTVSEAMRPISETKRAPDAAPESVETIPVPENAQRDTETKGYAARKLSPPQYDPRMWDGRVLTRYSDSHRFSLDYEVEAVGANGAEAIELWASTDGGESWDRWGSDPDLVSPFDIETKDEGAFGFRIVVLGRNGLTTPSPLPGETPDIVIVVDKRKPTVRITGASYGEGDRVGALVIRYECSDENLTQRPITLAFSDSPEGPWTTIAAGLRNHGDYVWPADPQLPRKLYLRVDATDRAGNVGSYVLDRAIDAQGLAPRARIRGFQSLSGVSSPAMDEQTAKRPKANFK